MFTLEKKGLVSKMEFALHNCAGLVLKETQLVLVLTRAGQQIRVSQSESAPTNTVKKNEIEQKALSEKTQISSEARTSIQSTMNKIDLLILKYK